MNSDLESNIFKGNYLDPEADLDLDLDADLEPDLDLEREPDGDLERDPDPERADPKKK
jgi:hypothetical protein